MRGFEIRYTNEFSFVTEWMSDSQEGFDLLREKTKVIAEKYMKFLSDIVDINGVHIEYYDLDSDNFGDDVIKWLVKLNGTDVEGITEELSNADGFVQIKHRVIDAKTKEMLLDGSFDECTDYIEKELPQFDITTDEGTSEIIKRMYIEEYEVKYLELK